MIENRDTKPERPNLQIVSLEELNQLHQDIQELQSYHDYPPNFLGPTAQYLHILELEWTSHAVKQEARQKIARYEELSKQYPWFIAKPTRAQLESNYSFLQAMSTPTDDPKADLEHYVQTRLDKKNSIDIVEDEYRKRRNRV